MDPKKTAIERAFELARSGEYQDLNDVERRIHKEGYSRDQLQGPSLRKQLRGLILTSRNAATAISGAEIVQTGRSRNSGKRNPMSA